LGQNAGKQYVFFKSSVKYMYWNRMLESNKFFNKERTYKCNFKQD
jgi:hypothetical protein